MRMDLRDLVIFSGTSNPELAQEIGQYLGVPLGDILVREFSDGELFAEIYQNVRGKDTFVIQPTSTPVNSPLMELLIIIDTLKRASANRITAVLPYYGYARQDSKVAPRVPISAKLVADLITVAGANRVLTVDLHRDQIQGFFDIPVDHLFAMPVQIEYLIAHFGRDLVLVSPDAGGVKRVREFGERMNMDIAIVNAREEDSLDPAQVDVIGDVNGRTTVILDDIVDTGRTLTMAASVLKTHGASRIYGCITHAVLAGESLERIEACPLERLVVTNTIRLPEKARASRKIECLSVAGLLGRAILSIHNDDSVSSLFV